jgi:hypothetical protein
MKIPDNKLFYYIVINLLLTSTLVLLQWYTGGFIEGIRGFIGRILFTPSFFILFLLIGPTKAMHFTTYSSYLVVSFVFYSVVIALIQTIIYKRKVHRRNKNGNGI